jgi:hypothetical protein
MKALIAVTLLIAASATTASAQVHVRGYTKKDGTYVAPHERTAPNNTTLDNYSTKGNVNPYTGKPGTKDPESYGMPSSPQLNTIQTGPEMQPMQGQQQANPYALPQPLPNRF